MTKKLAKTFLTTKNFLTGDKQTLATNKLSDFRLLFYFSLNFYLVSKQYFPVFI